MERNIRRYVIAGFIGIVAPVYVSAQATLRPTERPIVSAENERWYLAGEAITFAGSVYYPAGAQVYFNPYEMVRSGSYQGVPLYSRTTIEPYSVIFVPLAGGLLQPYERRRSGDVAGTVGSTTPSFPVASYAQVSGDLLPQASAPPTVETAIIGTGPTVSTDLSTQVPQPAATTGLNLPPAGPLRTARQPIGLNGFFIEYDGQRWFSTGRAVEFDAAKFSKIGEYRNFPVYSASDSNDRSIYVAVTADPKGLLAPYARRDTPPDGRESKPKDVNDAFERR
jgi:hypothetical protein